MSEKSERGLAPLSHWSPFAELDLLERFDPFRGRSSLRGLVEDLWGAPGRPARAFAPAVDVHESDDEYAISVELPGATKDDVNVELHEGVLTIRGEKKSESEEKKEHARWVERSYGTFSRSFTLPANADAEHMRASFKDGVLKLTLPKREEAKPRVINIQS